MRKISKLSPMEFLKYSVVTLFLSSSLAVLAQKSMGPMEHAGQTVDRTTQKAVGFVDDSAITAQVKADILKDPILKSNEISVETTKGVVSLTGVLDSQESINRALEIVRNNKNVSSVKNNLYLKTVK